MWGSPRRDRHPPSPFPLTWGLVVEDGLGGFGRWLLGGGYLLLLGLAEIALAGLERGGGQVVRTPIIIPRPPPPPATLTCSPRPGVPSLGAISPLVMGGVSRPWASSWGARWQPSPRGWVSPPPAASSSCSASQKVAGGSGSSSRLSRVPSSGSVAGGPSGAGAAGRGQAAGGVAPSLCHRSMRLSGLGVSPGWGSAATGNGEGSAGSRVIRSPRESPPAVHTGLGLGSSPGGSVALSSGPGKGQCCSGMTGPASWVLGLGESAREGTTVSGDRPPPHTPHPGPGCGGVSFGLGAAGRCCGDGWE